jgi:hypothetical protein
VRQRVTLAGRARRQQELPHGRGHAHRVGSHVVGHVLHHVVDRQPGVDAAAGRVDVDADVAPVVLGGEQDQLGADPVGDVVVNLLAEEDDPVPEHPLEKLVAERERWRLRGPRHDLLRLPLGRWRPA